MADAAEIQQRIQGQFQGDTVEVRDMTGDGDKFEILVVSSAFEGKRLVERHRMVYAAIGPEMGGPIHAASLKTVTPNEN